MHTSAWVLAAARSLLSSLFPPMPSAAAPPRPGRCLGVFTRSGKLGTGAALPGNQDALLPNAFQIGRWNVVPVMMAATGLQHGRDRSVQYGRDQFARLRVERVCVCGAHGGVRFASSSSAAAEWGARRRGRGGRGGRGRGRVVGGGVAFASRRFAALHGVSRGGRFAWAMASSERLVPPAASSAASSASASASAALSADGRTRRYVAFPGKNRFLCDGRIMQGPDRGMLFVTIALITVPSVVFAVVEYAWRWRRRTTRTPARVHTNTPTHKTTLGRDAALVRRAGQIMRDSLPWLTARLTAAVPVGFALLLAFTFGSLLATSFRDPGVFPRYTADPPPPPPPPPPRAPPADGALPQGYPALDPLPPLIIQEYVVNGRTIKTRFCDTCSIARPPRCHHCRTCDGCIGPWAAGRVPAATARSPPPRSVRRRTGRSNSDCSWPRGGGVRLTFPWELRSSLRRGQTCLHWTRRGPTTMPRPRRKTRGTLERVLARSPPPPRLEPHGG